MRMEPQDLMGTALSLRDRCPHPSGFTAAFLRIPQALNAPRLVNVKEPTDLFEAQMIRFALHGRSTAPRLESIGESVGGAVLTAKEFANQTVESMVKQVNSPRPQ
jgi:hypothetical protein